MSYIKLYDRVKELSYTQGTVSFELEGAVEGFISFSEAYSDGDALFYAVTDGTEYEVGSGVFIDGGIQRDQIARFPLRSSNANGLVSFSDGIKEVYVTYPSTHAVYHNSGVDSLQPPKDGGFAFWVSDNVLGYDRNIVWDDDNKRLGIRNMVPDYAIDVGGFGHESLVKASGYIVGLSGVTFLEGSNGDPSYPGGQQIEHFEKNNIVDANTSTIVEYSGVVNQFLTFKEQNKGFILAGPPSGCGDGCSPAKPFFRPLTIDDIPDLNSLYGTDQEVAEVSGVIISYIDSASGSLNNKINVVSGVLENYTYEVSGVLDYDLTEVSGSLNNKIDVVSGVLDNAIIASGTVFLQDLATASGTLRQHTNSVSGVLDNYIYELSGVLENYTYETSGVLDNYVEVTSGILYNYTEVTSGILNNTIIASGVNVSGVLKNYIDYTSGVLNNTIMASGENVSGVLRNWITTVSGILDNTIMVSGENLSGILENYIDHTSGILNNAMIASGVNLSGVLMHYVDHTSGVLNNAMIASGVNLSGVLTHYVDHTSGVLNNAMIASGVNLSGVLTHYVDHTSGVLNNTIIASGENVSGVLRNWITTVSGILDNTIMVSGENISGVLYNTIVESGIQFLATLSSASGALHNELVSSGVNLSGILHNAIVESGIQYETLLNSASGALHNEIISSGVDLSGILRNEIVESGLQYLSTLSSASGALHNEIIVSDVTLSGILENYTAEVSGVIIDSGTRYFEDIHYVQESDSFNKLTVNIDTGADRSQVLFKYANTGVSDTFPTHVRISNSGVASRLLLENLYRNPGANQYGFYQPSGNTWGVVSLYDGSYRIYNYTADYTTTVTGVVDDTIYLDSGDYSRNLMPTALHQTVSRTVTVDQNDNIAAGAYVVNQTGVAGSPEYGHILTLNEGAVESTVTTPFEVTIREFGREAFCINADCDVGIKVDPANVTADLDIRGDSIRLRNSGVVPTSSTTGNQGEIRWDSNYVYVCVAANTWKRASLSTW